MAQRSRLSWAAGVLCALTVPAFAQSGRCGDAGEALHPMRAEAVARHVAYDAPQLALVGVTLIDGSGAAPLANQTVVFVDGRIAAIGEDGQVDVPAAACRLALPGRTVIPGIVGMHNHTHIPGVPLMSHSAPRLYLAAGVTTIATAGSADAAGEIALASAIAAGSVPGPRIIPSAPYVTGPGGNGPMAKPASAAEARRFVRHWAGRGAKRFKLYRHVQPGIAAAIIEEAHRHGLRVTGHLCSLGFGEAARLGIDGIEHGLLSATDFAPERAAGECVSARSRIPALDLDGEDVRELIALLVREGVTLTATPAIIETHFAHRPQADPRTLAVLSPALRQAYRARQAQLAEDPTSMFQPALLAKLFGFERRFVAAGGRLVAGPDTGRHVVPGFGDQRNFELLVEAGFGVAQTIRIMTANGADALGMGDELGMLRTGLRADAVVLAGDLARDPSAIRNTELVFRGGVGFDPASLLEEVQGQVGLR